MTTHSSPVFMSDADILKAKLLTLETQKYIINLVATFTDELLSVKFSANTEQQTEQMLQYIYIQGRREVLLDLLSECDSAYAQIQSQPL